MEAKYPGLVDGRHLYGINIRVKGPHEELNNEVKRIGYIRDRETEMQIRIGDTLIVYISNSVA